MRALAAPSVSLFYRSVRPTSTRFQIGFDLIAISQQFAKYIALPPLKDRDSQTTGQSDILQLRGGDGDVGQSTYGRRRRCHADARRAHQKRHDGLFLKTARKPFGVGNGTRHENQWESISTSEIKTKTNNKIKLTESNSPGSGKALGVEVRS